MTRWPARLAPPVYPAETQAMMYWQSRHRLRYPPQLTDLRQLARDTRRTWPTTTVEAPTTGGQEKANEVGRRV